MFRQLPNRLKMTYKLVIHVIRNQRFFVYKINDISFRRRLFCIFDKKQPFELSIDYRELTKSLEVTPINGKRAGVLFQERIYKRYSFRFETEEECKFNLDEIKKKKELIDKMLIGFTTDMLQNKK